MDLELSTRCEKDRLVIEDGRATLQSGPVSQVFEKSKTTLALVFIILLLTLYTVQYQHIGAMNQGALR
jgi:hypothetical protein